MHEVVVIQVGGNTFRDILRGTWQATVARILNRNKNRKANNAFSDTTITKVLGKDHWICRCQRMNARNVVVEYIENITVRIEQAGT